MTLLNRDLQSQDQARRYTLSLVQRRATAADIDTLKRLCAGNAAAIDALDRVTTGKPGDNQYTVVNDNIMGHDNADQGTSAAYALRKFRKDAPELHARVLAGELTPHGAMVEAGPGLGLRPSPPVQYPRTPDFVKSVRA